MNNNDVALLLNNPGIIRNKLKIHAAIENARAFLKIKEDKWKYPRKVYENNGVRELNYYAEPIARV